MVGRYEAALNSSYLTSEIILSALHLVEPTEDQRLLAMLAGDALRKYLRSP